jgi:hypothetical protein
MKQPFNVWNEVKQSITKGNSQAGFLGLEAGDESFGWGRKCF